MKNSIILSTAEVRAVMAGETVEVELPLKPQPIDVLPMDVPNAWVTLETTNPNRGSAIYAPYEVGQVITAMDVLLDELCQVTVTDVRVEKRDIWKWIVEVQK
jgi:hypothetical protein